MQGFLALLSFAALVAFIIALIKPQKMVFWTQKKTRGMACLYLAAFIVFGVVSASAGSNTSTPVSASSNGTAGSSLAPVSSDGTQSSAPSSAAPSSSAPELKPFSEKFSSGFYTAGVDFPAGTYNLKAVKGSGNVISTDGTLNVIMGTQSDDMYEKTYNNAEFSNGTILSISNVTVELASVDDVDPTLEKRTNPATQEYTFSSGNYVVGKDIDAGIYTLTPQKGNGNVISDDGVLNAIMGTDDDDMYQKEFKNVPLADGTKLTITGITVKLAPSK